MLHNQNLTPYCFIYYILLSLIIVFLLNACNNNETAIESTTLPFPTQEPQPILKATPQIPPTKTVNNNSGILPPNNIDNDGINLEQDSLIPPIPPSQLTAHFVQDCTELNWQGTGSDIIVFYNIYRRQIDTEMWYLIATVPMEADNRGNYTFCDATTDGHPSSYEYTVSALDHYNTESAFSASTIVNYDE